MDDFRSLRHFLEVTREGSFTVAARKLGVSTPALSKSIAGLEKRLGRQLLIRTTRSVHLSDEGRALFERLAPSFETIEATLRQVGTARQEPVGRVRLSTVTAYGKHCIVPLLPEFFSLHPGIEVLMSFHDGTRGLTRQTFDIRINWAERPEQGKVAQMLSVMPLALVGSPDYLERRGTPTKPEDLAAHDCIGTAMANDSRSHWIFTRTGTRKRSKAGYFEFVPKGNLIVMDELDAVVDAARIGMGLTVMSADCIVEELRNRSLIRLMADYEISGNVAGQSKIIMQYPARKHLSPKVAVLVYFLLERLRGRNPLNVAGTL